MKTLLKKFGNCSQKIANNGLDDVDIGPGLTTAKHAKLDDLATFA